MKRVLCMHAAGTQLIVEGVDGGSREGALRLAGPACTSETRRLIRELLVEPGWHITVDLFVAQNNEIAARLCPGRTIRTGSMSMLLAWAV